MSTILLKSHLGSPEKKMSAPIEEAMRSALEGHKEVRIDSLSQHQISGRFEGGSHFSFEFNGTPPHGLISGTRGDRSEFAMEKVAFFELTAYDGQGHFLPDHPTVDQLALIHRIQVDVGIHDATETTSFYINDRQHGIDLDGDPTNGVAKITSRSFGLILQ